VNRLATRTSFGLTLATALVALALAALPAQASLVAWYTFDGQNIDDSSPNTNNGAAASSVTFSADTPPVVGGAYSLETTGQGTNYLVTVPTSPSLQSISNACTLNFWMKANTQPSNWVRLFQHASEASGTQGWMVNRYGGSNDVNVRTDTLGTGGQFNVNWAVGGSSPFDGTWHHVAYSFGGGQWTEYFDGAPVGSGTYPHGQGFANSRPFVMAGRLPQGGEYVGLLDDVSLYSHRLSDQEIMDLYTGTVSPTGITAREDVTFRIQVGAPASNASCTAYVNDTGTVSTLGTQFTSGSTSGNQLTLTGTAPLRVGATDYIQIAADWVGTPSQATAPSLTAQFTAPPGFIFAETGNQYLTTTTAWNSGAAEWGSFTYPDPATTYEVTSPNPAPSGFAAGTQSIWGQTNDFLAPIITPGYFDTQATLQQGVWSVIGGRVDDIGQAQEGLSAHIVRVDNNLDDLGQADTALTLRRNDANHSVSSVGVLNYADLDTGGGSYSPPAGVLPGDHHSGGANPEDYAVRVAGWVYANADDVRTFALSGDDGYYFRVGDMEWVRREGWHNSPEVSTMATMRFPETGYYPIELVWRNRGGGGGFEISSAPGTWTTWNSTDFDILGTDPAFPVYQRPDGLGDVSNAGADDVGGAVYTGTISPVPDGFRVQQAFPGGGIGNVNQSISYYGDKIIQNGDTTAYNVGAVETRANMDMVDPQNAGNGNWGFNNPFPINTPANDDNFVTRINGLVYIPEPGTYTTTVGTDDGFYLRIGDQVLGHFDGGRGVPGGTANYMYGYFSQAGLYPFEFYHHEGGGGSGIEIAHNTAANPTTMPNLLLTTRNPADPSNGLSVDWTGSAYVAQPVAELAIDPPGGIVISARAFTNVPALGMAVNPERWTLWERVSGGPARVPGLLATLYNTNAAQTPDWREDWPVLGTQSWPVEPQAFTTGSGTRYAFGGAYPGDQIAARWTGYLNVPQTGVYSFRMDTDDRSWIFIDVDGDGTLEGAPGNDAWTVTWNGVLLTEGLHAVEFRAREFGGGEWSNLQWTGPGIGWQYIPGQYFSQNVFDGAWAVIATGTGAVGDLLNMEPLMAFDFGSTHTLRLTTEVAGLMAVYEGTFTFIPEPGTMLVLAGGLLAMAARRRRNRR